MKRLYTILSLMICTLSVYAQNNVFILVDVSKSVTKVDLNNAKQTLTEVLTGSQLTKAFVSQGSQADLANFKLVKGDKLAVSKFGSLLTTLAINPTQTQIQNVGIDVSQVLNSTEWTPTDNQTYITLAKAKIAEYAKNHNITKYKLYIISDNVNDDYGHGGKPNYPDDYTRNLAEGYNTSTNPVSESGYTKLKFTTSSLFTLSFSPSVDVSKWNPSGSDSDGDGVPDVNDKCPGTLTGAQVDSNGCPSDSGSNPTIKLTTFADGKKDKPKPTGSNSFTISWTCNCPPNVKYNVMLTQLDGGKYKDLSKKDLTTNLVKFSDVPGGKFKVVISALNVNSATTFIETPSSGYGWLVFLLIFIAAIGIGYYFWNKKRQEEIDTFASNKADDIFSKSSGGTTSSNSSNSEYF